MKSPINITEQQKLLLLALIGIQISLIHCFTATNGQPPKQLAINQVVIRTQETAQKTASQNATAATAASAQLPSEGRSNEGNSQVNRGRAGRMLDLDQLVGDIGKSEKIARERMHSGDRQSRILSDDLFLSSGNQNQGADGKSGNEKQARSSAKKSGKKMSISGFIPIVSVEALKEGKQFDLEQEDPSPDSTGEQVDGSQAQQSVSNLLSSYGGQTSLGHASFAPQQQQQQQQFLQEQQQELDRAARKSSLIQQQHSILGHSIQGPLNAIQGFGQQVNGEQSADCICVPFFQCRNGFLSESQLSKNQLQQFQSTAEQQRFPLPSNSYLQSPRTLTGQQQQVAASQLGAQFSYQQPQNLFSAQQQQQQQQQQGQLPGGLTSDELIYEQLKKTIESENLQEQAAAFQQPPLVDERSAKSTNESSILQTELLERSLLNPLVSLKRSSGSPRSCGIMRTCCRFPPSFHPQYPQHQQSLLSQSAFGNFAAGSQRLPSRLLGPQVAQQSLQPVPTQRFQQQQQQQLLQQQMKLQYQQLRPQTAQTLPPQTSTLMDQYQPAGVNLGLSQQQQQQHQPGEFMAGRCGLKQTIGISGRVQNQQPSPGSESTAEFGEFPSHVAILKRLPSANGDSLFLCSAVLISNQWLATAAHCVRKVRAQELKVRLGEWDVSRDDEFYPFVESNIRDIVVHPDFQASSLINDVALLRMETTIDPQQMPHITPACLATPNEIFAGQRCWLTGWGKDAFGQSGSFQSVLKKVDLPVVGRHECEMALRHQTKLGKFFRLHSSAICAGGERGKDACEGDGGAGLYCTDPNSGLTKAAGLVSWGVGCGQVGVPGVYTNLAAFYGWIEQVAASSGEESLYMDRNSGLPEGAFKSIISERTMGGTINATISSSAQPSLAISVSNNNSSSSTTTTQTTTAQTLINPKRETTIST